MNAASLALPFELDLYGAVDAGRARSNNEDAVLLDAAAGLAVLADGMGGYNAGEVASEMAVAHVHAAVTLYLNEMSARGRDASDAQMRAALTRGSREANQAVYEASQTNTDYAGMGTTLVSVLFRESQVWIGHIGDSRVYRFRSGQLQQLTRDHSLLQEQIDAGLLTAEEALLSVNRNLVTRALGIDPQVELEIHEHAVQPGDVYLLCSDGLSDMLSDAAIATLMAQSQESLQSTAAALINAANEAGGRDNIAVILARARVGRGASGRSWWPFRRL